MNFQKLCLILLFTASAAIGSASATCTNASLEGVFGYLHGRPGGAPLGGSIPTTVVGQMTLDGQGNITAASWTKTQAGTVTTGTTTGTYSISNACTGTLTLDDEVFSPSNFNIYLNAGGKMFQMIQTDSGSNQPGFALAQGTTTCGLAGKKGAATTNLVGVTTTGHITDTIGEVTLDGHGTISGTEVFTNNGTVSTLSVTGTYTEDSSCVGTWQITPSGGAAQNFNTVRVNGKELLLIETDAGTDTAGNAQLALGK